MKRIRRFEDGDETELAAIIHRDFFEVNVRDYTLEALQYWASLYTPEYVRALSQKAHMYVMAEDAGLLGTCSISRESKSESLIEALYVLPDRQGEGIASELLGAVERDKYFEDAEIVWVHSSITARTFYEKKGYLHETGEPVCIENDRYVMYKKP